MERKNKDYVYRIGNVILFTAIITLSIRGIILYNNHGLQSCIIETDGLTGEETEMCFNSSKERTEYIDELFEKEVNGYPKKIDYNYINNFTNLTSIG